MNKPRMKSMEPKLSHLKLMQGLKDALKDCVSDDTTGEDMLAVVAQLLGNIIALQDQTKYTPDMVMELVIQNIQVGNQTAVETILTPEGSA